MFKDFDIDTEFGDLPPSFFDEMWSVEREYKNRIYEFDLDSRESETSWLVNSINKRLSVKGLLPLSPGQERKAHNYYYNFSLEHLEYVCEMGDIVACEVRDDRFTETVDNKGDGSGRKKADMNAKGTKRPDGPFAQETLNDKYQRAKIKEEYYREKARRSMDRYNTARRVGDIDAQIDFRQEHENNKREL